jgi:hypothetical protein
MTTASLKTSAYSIFCARNGAPLITSIIVNRRHVRLANRITALKRVGKGIFSGTANGESFTITGGKHGGGTEREWFLSWPPVTSDGTFNRPVEVTSVVEAINIIEDA